jgi:hypothetical protein
MSLTDPKSNAGPKESADPKATTVPRWRAARPRSASRGVAGAPADERLEPLPVLRPPTDPTMATVHRIIAIVFLVLLGARLQVFQGFTVGFGVALILLPLWVGELRRYRGGVVLLLGGVAAAVSGLWLTAAMADDHQTGQGVAIGATIVLLGPLVSVACIVWTRTVLTPSHIIVFYGLGLLVRAVIAGPGGTAYMSNVWKFQYSVPLTVILLGLALATRRRWIEVAVVAALAAVSILNDSRSMFAILLLTLCLVAWQMRSAGKSRKASTARVIIGIGIAAAFVFNIGQALLLDGVFGAETQSRTVAQLDQSGSILLGGRPELAATAALFLHQPSGYGSGTYASLSDVLVAKTGMASIGYDPNNGYVERFMFGTGFEVHSTIGDLWVRFGLIGLALAGLIAWLTIYGLGHGIARRNASAVVIFLGVRTCWDLFFSPLYSSVPTLTLFLGLALILKVGTDGPPAGRHPVLASEHRREDTA